MLLGLTLALAAPGTSSAATTVVSLEFDHGRAQQLSLLPVLTKYGMPSTFFVNSGRIGTGSGYMTWPQVRSVYAAGHEIGGHTLSHRDPNGLSLATQVHEVCDDRAALLSRGFPVGSFAFPFGSSALSKAIVAGCGYNSARRNGGLAGPDCSPEICPYAESIPPRDTYSTRTPTGITSFTPLSTVMGYVTQAEQNGGGWVQLVFPYTCSTCDISPAQLEAILSWLAPRAANGTVVRPVRQVIRGRLQPPPYTGSGGLFPGALDTIAPQLVRFSLTRRRFAVGRPRAGSRRGTTFRYIVSEPGRVTFRIQRALPGRRSRGRCRRPTLRLLQARRCTRYVTVGSFTRTIRRLSNRTAFTGRVRGKALRGGRYRVVATARDGSGNRSRQRKARFRVVSR